MILIIPSFLLLLRLAVTLAHDPAKILTLLNEGVVLTVACVGDSITNGKYLGELLYPKLLQQKLGSSRFRVLNFGLDGSCMIKTCSKPYWQTKDYTAAKASQPNIVIIQFGTNDPKFGLYNKRLQWNTTGKHSENIFREDFIDMVERFQSLKSHPTVFLCIPPPVYCRRCWFDINAKIINEELPAIITDIAYRTGAVLINNFEPLGGPTLSKPLMFYKNADPRLWPEKMPEDGVHPNAAGSEQIADTISWKLLEYLHHMNRTLSAYGGKFGGSATNIPGQLHPGFKHDITVIKAAAGVTEGAGQLQQQPVYIPEEEQFRPSEKQVSKQLDRALSRFDGHKISTDFSSDRRNMTATTAAAAVTRKVIACVGDSITEGLGSSDSSVMSYPAILQRHPGFHHYIVKNFGVSAYCASKHAGRFSYWRHPKYKAAMQSNPDIVIIQLGTNDAQKKYWNEVAFRKDYKEMILGFVNLPSKPTVYLCIPPPIYGIPENEEEKLFQHNVNREFPNRIIPELANETGTMLINNFEALGGSQLRRPDTLVHKEWPYDHIHPNDFGYLALAHEIAYSVRMHQHRTNTHTPSTATTTGTATSTSASTRRRSRQRLSIL